MTTKTKIPKGDRVLNSFTVKLSKEEGEILLKIHERINSLFPGGGVKQTTILKSCCVVGLRSLAGDGVVDLTVPAKLRGVRIRRD